MWLWACGRVGVWAVRGVEVCGGVWRCVEVCGCLVLQWPGGWVGVRAHGLGIDVWSKLILEKYFKYVVRVWVNVCGGACVRVPCASIVLLDSDSTTGHT